MKITMYNMTVPLFIKALVNMRSILDKAEEYAEEKGFEQSYLLDFRLYPDQYPLYRQIRIACIEAKGAPARLAGIDAPKFKDKDNEPSIEDLKSRINRTIVFLKSIKAKDIDGTEEKRIPISFKPGKYLTGLEYITEMVLPNFYFHITTAYSILRHNGLDIGKKDYLGEIGLKDE